ncbi:MAG: hypothetical protein LQ341_007263 [Variospora aurantia]|nr:MAG: hypothetical protein LQ341_007263 [Variospora aurantia]
MPWAKFLSPVALPQKGRKMFDESVLPEPGASRSGSSLDQLVYLTSKEGIIRKGDIVAIPSDTNTAWKTDDKYWYTYVQGRKTTLQETLEPVVLLEHAVDGDPTMALVRRLLRKKDDYGDLGADSNELVYSCRSDVFRREGQTPAPYSRNGAGDCYYLILGENDSGELEAISHSHAVINQGFDPTAPAAVQQPMRGLDLFCGGGNLGRGSEEGGAVKMEWAVDYFNEAIHPYHANSWNFSEALQWIRQ